MTDFLGRAAARAVGANAPARPRVAGLFEPAGAAVDATLEVVEEEVVAPGPAPQRNETPERGQPAAPPAEAPPAEVAQPPDPTEVRAAPRPAPPPDFVALSNDVPAPPTAIGPREAEPEPVPVARFEQSVPAPVVAAAPLAQALPVAAARGAAAPPPDAARDEEPPVRVHIGRLEVRASVQPPAPERPRREPALPEGPSLADYLRGKREVRA